MRRFDGERRVDGTALHRQTPSVVAPSLTPAELTLRVLLRIIGAGLLLAAVVYLDLVTL